MSSVTVTIQIEGLSKTKLQALRTQAKLAGISTESYAKKLLEAGISLQQQARTQSFDELTTEIRADFDASGMTERELDQLVNAARNRHHARVTRKKR